MAPSFPRCWIGLSSGPCATLENRAEKEREGDVMLKQVVVTNSRHVIQCNILVEVGLGHVNKKQILFLLIFMDDS